MIISGIIVECLLTLSYFLLIFCVILRNRFCIRLKSTVQLLKRSEKILKNKYKKKFIFFPVLAFIASLIFVGSGFVTSVDVSAQEESQTEEPQTQDENNPNDETQPTYIIGTDTTYAPFEFVNEEGEFVGIDMDILDAIAEDQGFNYELNILGFNAAVQALESGQVDAVMAGMGITEERQQSFDFTDPYYETATVFGVDANSDTQSMEDLEGENVAVKTGTTGAAVAQDLQDEYDFEITQFEDSVNMYEDVTAGNSVAAVEDLPVMQYAISTGAVDFELIGEPMESVPLGVAVQQDQNQEFVEMFNEGLQNIQASGEYDAIIESYLGEEALEENQVSSGVFGLIQGNWQPLLEGLWTTVWLTVVSVAIALIIGIVLGLMRTGSNTFLRGIALFYIDVFRGIPMIVLSFFIYFGIPQMTGINLSSVQAGILTLSLNASAYFGEIVRGGIQAVDQGQVEASRSLGMPTGKTMRYVVLPQAVKIMVPSMINQFVITLKDSSILSVIGLVELTQTGQIIIARTYQSGAMWLIIGAMYVILITALTKTSNYLERKWIR